MKRAQFFVLLLLIEQLLLSQNLVINPGFESWSIKTKPAGWTHIENCQKDSVIVKSGIYSCQHSGGVSTTSDLGQTISVSPGKEYLLSLFYKTVITASGNGARIWCYWKNESGASILDPLTDEIMRPSKYLKSIEWEQFNATLPAPANAVAFYLEVRTYPNSITYWDEIIFEENIATIISSGELTPISIYPNPATNYLNISNLHKLQSIDIQNITGKVVWSCKFNGEPEVTIPLSGLNDGLYFVRINMSEKHYLRKFLKKTE